MQACGSDPFGRRFVQKIFKIFSPPKSDRLLGDWQMEWSLMNTSRKTGWLYFARPKSNDELWEFAPCSRASLQNLVAADFTGEFLRRGDPRIESVFGTHPDFRAAGVFSGRAIPVREGQIVLARLLHPPHTLYAVKLVDQKGAENWGSIGIEYVEIDSSKPVRGASKREPAALLTNKGILLAN